MAELNKEVIPAGARRIIETLQAREKQAFLVGGCVRDLLLGRPVREWDLTTSARPEEVSQLFPKVVPTGLAYGTVTVLLPDGSYEVTTFRSDEHYVDGRHPSNVKFTDDIHQDLSRRDFTINALAYDPASGRLIDDFQGRQDLAARLIRAVGDPLARFSEDGLRSVRACRFAAQLDFQIEPGTLAAIGPTLAVTRQVAPERLRDELVKLLAAERPSIGLELMRQSGLLQLVLPELDACYGVEQPPDFHKYDVYWHDLRACDAAPRGELVLRLAALLHDIAKPACKVDLTFYNHDKAGAELAGEALRRLKFSNQQIEQITSLISHHMFNYTSEWSDAAVRRFLRRIGGPANVPALFALRRADTSAMEQEIGSEYLGELQERIDRIVAGEQALDVADLKVNGEDVLRELKLKPGPKVGEVLAALLEKVLDDPALNERETLLKMIREHA